MAQKTIAAAAYLLPAPQKGGSSSVAEPYGDGVGAPNQHQDGERK